MDEWLLSVTEAAELLAITERAVQKNALAGKYGEVRYTESSAGGGKGGKVLRIPLAALPAEIQSRYHLKNASQTVAQDESAAADDDFNRAPEWNRQEAYQRYNVLKTWWSYLQQHKGRGKVETTREFLEAFRLDDGSKLTMGTLYRYEKDYREKGLTGLLTEYGKKKGKHNVKQAIWDDFCALYLTPKKRSIGYCYKRIKAQHGDGIPSLETFQRMVREMPSAVRDAMREPAKFLHDRHLPYTIRDPESVAGNEIWVGDHFRADFSIIGPNGRTAARPWMTIWLDFRSRKVVGGHVDYTPSTGTILAAFAEAALDPNIGLPAAIQTDNGRDYCSRELTAEGGYRKKAAIENPEEIQWATPLMERLGIKTYFAQPENARSKVVEREFRTFAEELCKEFDTYCGNRPGAKPEDLNQKLKEKNLPKYAITLDQLRTLFADWIRYVKNKEVSYGKGREGESPDETFARTRLPLRLAPPGALKILFKRQSKPVKVDRCMVTFRGEKYFHEALALHNGKQVYLRYLDSNLNEVSVWTMNDEWIVDAPIVNAIKAFGASKEDHAAEGRRKKQAKERIMSHPAVEAKKRGNPDTFEEYIAKAKQKAEPEAPPPNVIIPVNVGQPILDSVKKMAVGQNETAKRKLDVMSILGKKQNFGGVDCVHYDQCQ